MGAVTAAVAARIGNRRQKQRQECLHELREKAGHSNSNGSRILGFNDLSGNRKYLLGTFTAAENNVTTGCKPKNAAPCYCTHSPSAYVHRLRLHLTGLGGQEHCAHWSQDDWCDQPSGQ